jgi:hypothetical protein
MDDDIFGVDDAKTPGELARIVSTVPKLRIGRELSNVRLEGLGGGWVRLVVRTLRLYMAEEDVLCLVELILVENCVLRAGPVEPGRPLRLDQQRPPGVEADLVRGRIPLRISLFIVVARPGQRSLVRWDLDLLIRKPHPDVLEVTGGFRSHVHQERCTDALWTVSSLWAGREIEIGTFGAADANVGIPHCGCKC